MSESKPLVSILINNYNYGQFLREAIDSALNQTYPNTEVIVVDDGSTDDSREIIGSYGDHILPVFQENGGQGAAFNAGFATCKGSLVCHLDSDDIWLAQKVENVVEAARAHPEAVFIYHKVQPVSSDLRAVRKVIPSRLLQGDIASKVEHSGGWWARAPTSALSMTRDVLQRMGPVPEEEFRICADAFLAYLLPCMGPVVGLPEDLALYRLHGGNSHSSVAVPWKAREREMFLSRAASYQNYVVSVNQRLQELQSSAMLKLERHWNYQFAKYLARSPDRLPLGRFIWRTLCYPGEPSVLNRLRMAAALVRNCPWKRDRVPSGSASGPTLPGSKRPVR